MKFPLFNEQQTFTPISKWFHRLIWHKSRNGHLTCLKSIKFFTLVRGNLTLASFLYQDLSIYWMQCLDCSCGVSKSNGTNEVSDHKTRYGQLSSREAVEAVCNEVSRAGSSIRNDIHHQKMHRLHGDNWPIFPPNCPILIFLQSSHSFPCHPLIMFPNCINSRYQLNQVTTLLIT